MVKLKSKDEIQLIREGGKILANVLRQVSEKVKPGVTTAELDELAEQLILEAGGRPSFKGYGEGSNPFPSALCTSINAELVHGIPSGRILREGEIISLDVGMQYPANNGLYTDMAVTLAVGKIDPKLKELMSVTKKALDIWIKRIKPGKRLNEIAKEVQEYIESKGFSVVRDLVGHGVGHAVHEPPQIPNYFVGGVDVELKEGMVLALEPMVGLNDYQVTTGDDGWTVLMADGEPSAHFEHTVAVVKGGSKVLTQ